MVSTADRTKGVILGGKKKDKFKICLSDEIIGGKGGASDAVAATEGTKPPMQQWTRLPTEGNFKKIV